MVIHWSCLAYICGFTYTFHFLLIDVACCTIAYHMVRCTPITTLHRIVLTLPLLRHRNMHKNIQFCTKKLVYRRAVHYACKVAMLYCSHITALATWLAYGFTSIQQENLPQENLTHGNLVAQTSFKAQSQKGIVQLWSLLCVHDLFCIISFNMCGQIFLIHLAPHHTHYFSACAPRRIYSMNLRMDGFKYRTHAMIIAAYSGREYK